MFYIINYKFNEWKSIAFYDGSKNFLFKLKLTNDMGNSFNQNI